MEQSLEIKYRPKNFNEFYGNKSTVIALKSMLQREDGKKHSLLFTGPSGCGKTTLAGVVANELKININDLLFYNAANTRGIDTIREISQNCRFKPISGGARAYLLDECHMITKEGQNALLKIIEEPPNHIYFLLTTTDPQKLIKTIRNRCATFEVSLLGSREIKLLIGNVLEKEKVEGFPDEAITEIVRTCEGSPRKALVILDKVIDIDNDEDLLEAIREVQFGERQTIELCRALMKGDWSEISEILKGIKEDPEKVRYAVAGYLSAVVLNNGGSRVNDMLTYFCESFMYGGKPMLVNSCYLATRV